MASTLSVLPAIFAGLRSHPQSFIRDVGRYPLVREAEQLLANIPRVELAEILHASEFSVDIAPDSGRHGWSLGAAEQVIIQFLIEDRSVQDIFEIGTFNGGTTAMMAERVPAEGTVTTLDLPPDQFDATQTPANFTGMRVGEAYRKSPAVHKIRQLRVDSLAFNAVEWQRSADLVLIDGAHDYAHGFADSLTALRVVRPGGIVLWDDFQPFWHGLVKGVVDAMMGRDLVRLAGSAFGVYEVPETETMR